MIRQINLSIERLLLIFSIFSMVYMNLDRIKVTDFSPVSGKSIPGIKGKYCNLFGLIINECRFFSLCYNDRTRLKSVQK